MDFGDNLTEIILAVVAIFAVGAFIAIKKNNKVKQENINIGRDGDVTGRDKKVSKK